MKNRTAINIFFLVIICSSIVLFACADNSKDVLDEGDITELKQILAVGYDSLAAAKPENFERKDIAEFQQKLDLISSVANEGNLSKQEVINLNVHLKESMQTFENKRMFGISEEYLIASWDFDREGDSSLVAKGERQLIATLKWGSSHIFGSNVDYPMFINQGINGKSIYLNNGAYLAVDQYTPSDFLGRQLTISVWVKPDVIKGGNYIVSLNDWHNWKFQLQDQAKAFFTIATSAGIIDSDNERDLTAPIDTWTHIVVVLDLDSKEPLRFYTNGLLTKEWDKKQKPALTGTQVPLTAQVPLLIGAAVEYDAGWGEIDPNSWNYFQGAIDEIKFYNTSATAGQVRWLYNQEVFLLKED